ncbi:MAG: L,D-transpeptidase, partial [Deltaproteobacteria bacterium]|nr:L,D-transpeptidase [Deltaproteobacteria bacterium]
MVNSLFFKKTVYFWGVLVLILNVGGVGCPAQGIASEDGDNIPNVFISSSFGNEGHYALLVDKGAQQLIVYESRGGVIREKLRLRCSTGEIPGPKERSGDKKTPEGVYFIVNRFTAKDLTPVYGTRALPLDYPNLMDDMAGRSGYSIWIHGTDKPLKDRNSNGCIVLENPSIERIEQYIALNRTPVIIVGNLSFQDVDTFNKSKEKIFGF